MQIKVFQPHYPINFWEEYETIHYDEFKFLPWGATDIEVPEFHIKNIQEAASSMSIMDYQYGAFHGKHSLKNSICENFGSLYNFPKLDPEKNIIITPGDTGAIYHITTMLIQEDDEVLLLSPHYPVYLIKLNEIGGKAVFSRLKYDQENMEFEIDWEDLEAKISSKTKLFIITNPSNPTAKIYSREEYEKLTKILDKYPNILVLEDQAYCPYVNEGFKLTSFHEIGNNWQKTFTTYSGGKMMNVTGARVGWIIANEELTKLLLRFLPNVFTPAPSFEQIVMAKDLESTLFPYNGTEKNFYEWMADDIDKRTKKIKDFLAQFNIKSVIPQGSYYLVADISNIVHKIPEKYYFRLDNPSIREEFADRAFCRMLADKYRVGFMPISIFCSPEPYDNLVRISVNRNDQTFQFVFDALEECLASQDLDFSYNTLPTLVQA